jgi:hypothetical protein
MCRFHRRSIFVVAGLDPAIHQSRKDSREEKWMPGSSPGMTAFG